LEIRFVHAFRQQWHQLQSQFALPQVHAREWFDRINPFTLRGGFQDRRPNSYLGAHWVLRLRH